jgi:hypothetical protein
VKAFCGLRNKIIGGQKPVRPKSMLPEDGKPLDILGVASSSALNSLPKDLSNYL